MCIEQRVRKYIYMWFCRNKLQVNAAKTKSLLFHSSRKNQNDNTLLINLNGQEIEQVNCFKYLGLHVDPLLNFDAHIGALTKKSENPATVESALLYRYGTNQFLYIAPTCTMALQNE